MKSNPGCLKWVQEQSGFLIEEITNSLSPLLDNAGFYNVIQEILSATKRATGTANTQPPWHLLPLIACHAVCGGCKKALPAAASRMLLLAAADIFDDLEDADSMNTFSVKYGTAVTINAATTLIFLAEKTAARLKNRHLSGENALKIIELLNSTYIDACSGQHLDLTLKLNKDISEEDYLNTISLKSGSQIEYACEIGALSAGANKNITEKMGAFGHEIGMITQIANDIRGIIIGNDIINRKPTLPVIFAYTQKVAGYKQLGSFFKERNHETCSPSMIRDILFSAGAIQYSLVIIEEYKQSAHDILAALMKSGVRTERLGLFLK